MSRALVCVIYLSVAVIFVKTSQLSDILLSGDYEFIDLTYPFDVHTIYWPNTTSFDFIKKDEHYISDGSWYASNEFQAGEHGGTHLDAPYHFAADGKRVGDIELDKLIVSLTIVDISSKVNDDPNFVLYKHHLDYMINDNMGKPTLLIFKFGWSKFINDKKKYIGLTSDNQLNFPGLSGEVVEWITTSYKNVKGIGVDVCSTDPGSSTDFPAHKIGAKAGLYNIENVKLDRYVPEHGCVALVLPMKIKVGSGAPLRLVAVCPKQIPEKF